MEGMGGEGSNRALPLARRSSNVGISPPFTGAERRDARGGAGPAGDGTVQTILMIMEYNRRKPQGFTLIPADGAAHRPGDSSRLLVLKTCH